jgi:hypothetical protein
VIRDKNASGRCDIKMSRARKLLEELKGNEKL